jgi:hypothetical protein
MIFSSSTHLPANDKTSFFFVAEKNSIVYKYYIFSQFLKMPKVILPDM